MKSYTRRGFLGKLGKGIAGCGVASLGLSFVGCNTQGKSDREKATADALKKVMEAPGELPPGVKIIFEHIQRIRNEFLKDDPSGGKWDGQVGELSLSYYFETDEWKDLKEATLGEPKWRAKRGHCTDYELLDVILTLADSDTEIPQVCYRLEPKGNNIMLIQGTNGYSISLSGDNAFSGLRGLFEKLDFNFQIPDSTPIYIAPQLGDVGVNATVVPGIGIVTREKHVSLGTLYNEGSHVIFGALRRRLYQKRIGGDQKIYSPNTKGLGITWHHVNEALSNVASMIWNLKNGVSLVVGASIIIAKDNPDIFKKYFSSKSKENIGEGYFNEGYENKAKGYALSMYLFMKRLEKNHKVMYDDLRNYFIGVNAIGDRSKVKTISDARATWDKIVTPKNIKNIFYNCITRNTDNTVETNALDVADIITDNIDQQAFQKYHEREVINYFNKAYENIK